MQSDDHNRKALLRPKSLGRMGGQSGEQRLFSVSIYALRLGVLILVMIRSVSSNIFSISLSDISMSII